MVETDLLGKHVSAVGRNLKGIVRAVWVEHSGNGWLKLTIESDDTHKLCDVYAKDCRVSRED